jgi:hypothetical protein
VSKDEAKLLLHRQAIEALGGVEAEPGCCAAAVPIGEQGHMFPLCCMQPWEMGTPFVVKCRAGVLQYVGIEIFCTLVTFISTTIVARGINNEGWSEYAPPGAASLLLQSLREMMHPIRYAPPGTLVYVGYVLVVVKNISQAVALYSLIIFEQGAGALLHPISPQAKFISIKLVILVTFWQEMALGIVEAAGWFSWEPFYDSLYVGALMREAADPAHCHPWCEAVCLNGACTSWTACTGVLAAVPNATVAGWGCVNAVCTGEAFSHSKCISTYGDDIGDVDKFSDKVTSATRRALARGHVITQQPRSLP